MDGLHSYAHPSISYLEFNAKLLRNLLSGHPRFLRLCHDRSHGNGVLEFVFLCLQRSNLSLLFFDFRIYHGNAIFNSSCAHCSALPF